MNKKWTKLLTFPTMIALILSATAFAYRPGINTPIFSIPNDNSVLIGADGDVPVRNETAFGLNTTTFDTLVGTVTVNLPDDLAAGDTISGTVISEAKKITGNNNAAPNPSEIIGPEINGYVVEVANQPTSSPKPSETEAPCLVSPGSSLARPDTSLQKQTAAAKNGGDPISVCKKWSIPEGVSKIPLVLKNREGKIVSRAEVPVGPKASVVKASDYLTPPVGQAGRPMSVNGPFDGDYANTEIKLQNKTAKFLASSPRKVVVEGPRDLKGMADIEVNYKGKIVAKCVYRSISIRLAADKLKLTKGEQTTMTVTLAGLIGLLSPVSIQLSNKSPETVSMAEGEKQTVNVDPADVNGDIFTTVRTLTGVQAGGYSISAFVDPAKSTASICGSGTVAKFPIVPMPRQTPDITRGPPNPQSTPLLFPPPSPQPTRQPSPPPSPQPSPPSCRLYGESGTASDGSSGTSVCCTSDTLISSVQSRFCEGVSPDLPGDLPERRGSETTIAFVPAWRDAAGGGHGARLVMGFNGIGPTGFLNWAISTDQARTWRQLDRTNGGPRVGASPGPVDNPTPRFNSYRGDLSVVALQHPGGVAMVSLADTPCTPSVVAPCPAYPDLIVLLVSIDGGETFSKTSVVNDRLGVGTTDQPRVTIDPADGTIWVMWRARLALTPFYTYVRGGHIGSNGSVDWDINGDGQLVFSNPYLATLDYQHPRFKVFKRPGALTHTIAVSGPQGAPALSLFGHDRCVPGTSGAIRNSFWQYPLGVFFAVSDDDGRHWTDLDSAVDMLQPFALGCVGGVGGRDATGQLIYSENRIDLARDTHNGNFLVTRARAVSDSTNAFIGQQVEVWRRSTTAGSRFTLVATAPWTAAHPWQFNPSVAARDDGQIAVSYYQTTGSSQTVELMVIGSLDGGNTWSTPVQLSRNSGQIVTDRSLGEYDEIVALPLSVTAPRIRDLPPGSDFWPGAFYASWGNGGMRVFAAGFSPPVP